MSAAWEFTEVRVELASRQHFNVLAVLLLPVLCALGLLGNLLVCMAIWFDRRLHNVTNYFLFSLALADLFVCSIVMPFSLLVEVGHGIWTWSFSVCLLYVYSDVFLCTASIVHMSVISLDRFLGISKPLKTRNKSRTMITIKITLVWLITILISCPLAVAALLDHSNILHDNSCQISNRYYMVYGSTFAFLIPFIVMAVTYVKTTSLLKKQASMLSQRASDRANGNGLRRTMAHRKLDHTSRMSNGALHKGSNAIGSYSSFRMAAKTLISEDELQLLANPDEKLKAERSKLRRLRERTSTVFFAFASRVTRKNSLQTASQELANEHKATRVLAVVFGCFFVCWTPFFAANFAVGFCGERCEVPPGVASLFLWLGYVSSTLNPLIYTIFNRRFRQAFLRIIRCQCLHPIRDPTNTATYSRNNQTYLPTETHTCSNPERTPALISTVRKSSGYWNTNSWGTRNQSANDLAQPQFKRIRSETRPLLWDRDESASTEDDVNERLQNPADSSSTQNGAIKNASSEAQFHQKFVPLTRSHTNLEMRRHTVSRETITGIQKSLSASDFTGTRLATCDDDLNSPPISLFASALFTVPMRETFL